MKLILTHSRSTVTSVLLHCIINSSLIVLSVVFLTSASNSKSGIDLGHNHKQIVEEFKAKVLQHMGWSVPPRGYNASRHSLHGKLLREFFRKKLRANDHLLNFDSIVRREDSYLDDLQTVVFPSTIPDLWVPVQPANIPSSASLLTTIKFTTNFQQPDTPYHDLLVQSALLRMRISRQKRKFRSKNKSTVNVSFYLLSQSDGVFTENTTSHLIHSLTVSNLKMRTIEINISPYLLSHIVESEDKTITIGVKVEEVSAIKHDDDNLQIFPLHSKEKTLPNASQPKEERIRISNTSLRVTTQTKDLRKSRTKRQNNDSPNCTENMCCRRSVYVDFADIGWNDWVLYPSGYTAYYCKGECPDRYKVASSFTGIKSILHERFPTEVPEPACAPTGYNPLDMIIYDGDVKDVTYPGMVVTGCRCY